MNKIIVAVALYITSLVINTLSAQNEVTQFNTLEETLKYAIANANNLEEAKIDQDIVLFKIAEDKEYASPQINSNEGFINNFSY